MPELGEVETDALFHELASRFRHFVALYDEPLGQGGHVGSFRKMEDSIITTIGLCTWGEIAFAAGLQPVLDEDDDED